MKVEKSGKKKQRTEYQTPSLFQDMKFKDKFDVSLKSIYHSILD